MTDGARDVSYCEVTRSSGPRGVFVSRLHHLVFDRLLSGVQQLSRLPVTLRKHHPSVARFRLQGYACDTHRPTRKGRASAPSQALW